jgi:hypothetical protein
VDGTAHFGAGIHQNNAKRGKQYENNAFIYMGGFGQSGFSCFDPLG